MYAGVELVLSSDLVIYARRASRGPVGSSSAPQPIAPFARLLRPASRPRARAPPQDLQTGRRAGGVAPTAGGDPSTHGTPEPRGYGCARASHPVPSMTRQFQDCATSTLLFSNAQTRSGPDSVTSRDRPGEASISESWQSILDDSGSRAAHLTSRHCSRRNPSICHGSMTSRDMWRKVLANPPGTKLHSHGGGGV